MKHLSFSFRLILVPILLVVFVSQGFAQQSLLTTEVAMVQAQTKQMPLPIFDLQTTRTLGPDARLNGQGTTFQLNRNVLNDLLEHRYAAISIMVPMREGEILQLELIQNQIFTGDFKVLENSGKGASQVQDGFPEGLFFKGVVLGWPGAWAAISFFENEISGIIALGETNLTLALQQDENRRPTNTCLLYDESQLREKPPFSCGVDALDGMKKAVRGQASPDVVGCPPVVRIYFECDYDMYLRFGANTSMAIANVTSLFNCIATLYANENVKVKISGVSVWTTPDPYIDKTTSKAVTIAFGFDKDASGYSGDVAHLLSTRSGNLGGFAWKKSLCSDAIWFRSGFSNISYSPDGYPGYPTYSFNVSLVAHELGHNLGSEHTQWCGWPSGAIDNCWATEPAFPGSPACSPGPAPVGGGTIMSYCDLPFGGIPGPGIDFTQGFGHYPGDTIRHFVNTSTCLWPAGPLGPVVSDIGATTANVTWTWGAPTCAVLYYRVTWQVVNANSFFTVNTNQTSFNLAGLSSNTQYIVKVDAMTTGGVWTDASSALFVTLPFPFYCASSGLPATPAWIDKFKLSRFPELNVTKTSGNNLGYANFTSTVFANLKKGSTYTTSISQGFVPPGPVSEYYYIWIDFNNDKDFADPGELVFSKGPSMAIPVSGTFTIPMAVMTGNTRMRVRMTNTGIALPCASAQWGEVEDYTINIVSALVVPGNGDGLLQGAPGISALATVGNTLILDEPKLIPNPANRSQPAYLTMEMAQTELASVEVFDVTGRQIWTFKSILDSGYQEIALPANQWTNGVYLVRLQSTTLNKTLKLIVNN